MTLTQQIITIALCVLATVLTRALPFAIFSRSKKTPKFIQYMGKYLPSAVFGMLVIYCLKDVNFFQGYHGAPEIVAILVTILLHVWKRKMILSISVGTIFYMLLVNLVFV